MRVRLKDVAAEAGVQPSTVSLILNKRPQSKRFSPAATQRVLDAAKRLGYQPNASARALVTNRTYNIGFIIPEYVENRWLNPFYASYLNGIDEVCIKYNYNLIVHCCSPKKTMEMAFPRSVNEKNIDGLILSSELGTNMLKYFEQMNLPCVRLGFSGEAASSPLPVIGPDTLKGRLLILEYLSRLNHRRVMCLYGGSQYSKNISRQLEEHLCNSSLSKKIRIFSEYTSHASCDSTSASIFFSLYFGIPENERPTALITNPQTCMSILKEMKKYGLNCPRDLSVVSMYDFDVFDYTFPGITSLKYNNAEIGAYAAENLIAAVNSTGSRINSHTGFPVTLEIRQSCASPGSRIPENMGFHPEENH